jgi:uncharacterized protein (DUF433 family)
VKQFERINHNAKIMGGKACIAGTRITVGMILLHISEGLSVNELIEEYPNLTAADVSAALQYAAWAIGTKEELAESA